MKNLKLQLTILTLAIFTCFSHNAIAQVGIGTITPDASAMLDLTSTDKGMLAPRMTSVQRIAIPSPAEGLLVFDTDENVFFFFDGGSWVRLIHENSTNDYTGWASYVDGTYTSASPLTLAGSVKVTLPNDATNTIDSQKPIDITEFYNSTNSTITGREGDGLNIVIEFKAKPTTGSVTRLTVAIDIGGAVGEIYIRDFVLAKGIGVEHYYLSSFDTYTLNTWETNGGTIKIVSTSAAEIYDIRYVLTRTHKAR
ncbi:hypothetical protein [Psychroserpens luteus]|uniref:Uncharacterized protein n=1 Tax=Psychroserpens luteus TaxID=1434066 RepID=A0ABW5ZNN2_9FLAO|nr:hypothetical protein [Psychroserpens luteus]